MKNNAKSDVNDFVYVGVAGQIVGLAILGSAFQFQQLASFKSDVAIGGLVIYVACFAFGTRPDLLVADF